MADMVFLFLFYNGFCIYHCPGKFVLRPEKFSKRFSFGGGSVRCFFSVENLILTFRIPHKKSLGGWLAYKCSFSLENVNPGGKS